MTLPNAHKGVQKLFIAEILQLIGVALALVGVASYGAILGAYEIGGTQAAYSMGGAAIGGTASMVGAVLLPIIALILSLVGLRQASKDEPDYMNKAFWCAIWALILAVVAGCLQAAGWRGGSSFFSFVGQILIICMTVFSIMGVSEVTQNISRQDVADMGPKVITFTVAALVIALIASLFGQFVAGIGAIISLALMLLAYVIYLVFLGKATSALAKG